MVNYTLKLIIQMVRVFVFMCFFLLLFKGDCSHFVDYDNKKELSFNGFYCVRFFFFITINKNLFETKQIELIQFIYMTFFRKYIQKKKKLEFIKHIIKFNIWSERKFEFPQNRNLKKKLRILYTDICMFIKELQCGKTAIGKYVSNFNKMPNN